MLLEFPLLPNGLLLHSLKWADHLLQNLRHWHVLDSPRSCGAKVKECGQCGTCPLCQGQRWQYHLYRRPPTRLGSARSGGGTVPLTPPLPPKQAVHFFETARTHSGISFLSRSDVRRTVPRRIYRRTCTPGDRRCANAVNPRDVHDSRRCKFDFSD